MSFSLSLLQLPFSRLMVDEILLRRDIEATVPEDLFTPAQNEVSTHSHRIQILGRSQRESIRRSAS